MTFLKITGIIIICLIATVALRSFKFEYSFLAVVAAMIVVLTVVFSSSMTETVAVIREMTEDAQLGGYIAALFKALGISYLAVITAEMCRSGGEETLAKLSEAAGKLEILLLCLPMASELIATAGGML